MGFYYIQRILSLSYEFFEKLLKMDLKIHSTNFIFSIEKILKYSLIGNVIPALLTYIYEIISIIDSSLFNLLKSLLMIIDKFNNFLNLNNDKNYLIEPLLLSDDYLSSMKIIGIFFKRILYLNIIRNTSSIYSKGYWKKIWN